MLLGEENHSSPVVYRGGMVFLPYRCLSDTLTPVFPFDSFINGSLENVFSQRDLLCFTHGPYTRGEPTEEGLCSPLYYDKFYK